MKLHVALLFLFISLSGLGQTIDTSLKFTEINVMLRDIKHEAMSDYSVFVIHGKSDTLMHRKVLDTLPLSLILKDTCDYRISVTKRCFVFNFEDKSLSHSTSRVIYSSQNKKPTYYFLTFSGQKAICHTRIPTIYFIENESEIDITCVRAFLDYVDIMKNKPLWKFRFTLEVLPEEQKGIGQLRLKYLKEQLKRLETDPSQVEFLIIVATNGPKDEEEFFKPTLRITVTSTE